jgi:hypothetical protein
MSQSHVVIGKEKQCTFLVQLKQQRRLQKRRVGLQQLEHQKWLQLVALLPLRL